MKNPHKKISALLGPESVGLSRVTPTIGTQGMIVSDDPIASEWGAELLRKGGNAIDAAIGAAFVLAVTRPYFASIGGGGFLLHRSHTNTSTLFNFRELSPELTTRKLYQHRGSFLRERLQNGPLSCGTPGAVAGYLHAL